MNVNLSLDGRRWTVQIERAGQPGDMAVSVKGHRRVVNAEWIDPDTLSLIDGGVSYRVRLSARDNGDVQVEVGGRTFDAMVIRGGRASATDSRKGKGPADSSGHYAVRAPMPGRVVRLLVAVGDHVRERQGVAVVEAMKMENELRTAREGTVKEVHVQAGAAVEAGAVVLVVAD